MIIYAVKIDDVRISSILNFIKYICAPNSKTEIHLSIRGPYKVKMSTDRVEALNKLIKDSKIRVNSAGNFFEYGQNTVFLKCSSNSIRKVWKKTEYGYNPHLTLYDGPDKEFAHMLFELLSNLQIDISFSASNLILYDTEKLIASALLTIGINHEIIEGIIGADWRSINFQEYNQSKKLQLIEQCISHL